MHLSSYSWLSSTVNLSVLMLSALTRAIRQLSQIAILDVEVADVVVVAAAAVVAVGPTKRRAGIVAGSPPLSLGLLAHRHRLASDAAAGPVRPD